MTKNHTRFERLPRRVSMFVTLLLLILWSVLFLAFIWNGLNQYFTMKSLETQRLTRILAHSALNGGSTLVASQVSESMRQDAIIEDILFYSIDYAIDFSEQTNDWQDILFGQTASFHQGVMTIDSNATDALANDDLSSANNQVLIGYINATLDMRALRQQWFYDNRGALFVLFVLSIASVLFAYWRLRLLLGQFEELGRHALQLTDDNDIFNSPVYSGKMSRAVKFADVTAINEWIITLQAKYREIESRVGQLLQTDVKTGVQRHSGQASMFTSMIVHELKSSLEVVFGGMQLIDKRFMTNEHSEALNIIEQGVNGINGTLNQIVQLNRIELGQIGVSLSELQPVQLINELVEYYQPTAKKYQLTLSAKLQHVDHTLAGDVKKIHSILDALISNAIKFTEIGSVTVISKLDYFLNDIRWTIKVTDTGVGIDANMLDNIFTPFFQLNPDFERDMDNKQMGLGVAKKLTELLGGELNVESEVGKGSSFVLSLPLKDWRQIERQRLLKGVRIVQLQHEVISHIQNVQVFQSYGAQSKSYTDVEALVDFLQQHTYDVLLIAGSVTAGEVAQLCMQIRGFETSHRILIAWQTTSILPSKFAELQATGLDYILDTKWSEKEQAHHIRSWVYGSA